MRWDLLVLRLIHIVSAVCWVGGTLLMVGFVLPSVKRAGPDGGKFMQLLVQRKMPQYLGIMAALLVLSGALMYWVVSGHLQAQWLGTSRGIMLTLGALFGIGAALSGTVFTAPAATRLEAIGRQVQTSGGPPSAEQAAEMRSLQQRLVTGAHITAGLMVVALVLMVVSK